MERAIICVTKTSILNVLSFVLGGLSAGLTHHLVFVEWVVQNLVPFLGGKSGFSNLCGLQKYRLQVQTNSSKISQSCHQDIQIEGSALWGVGSVLV